MNIRQLIEQKSRQLKEQHYLTFTAAELSEFRPDQADVIVETFHGAALMELPEAEIRFFDWLQQEDPLVWKDLWGDEENLYLVSIDLLPQFIEGSAGFPICDLEGQPNYWFNARHIKPKGQEYLEFILEKMEAGGTVNLSEAFLLQVSTVPTDIWHFCYNHNTAIQTIKDEIEEMVYQGWLVHLPDREDLVKYIDI